MKYDFSAAVAQSWRVLHAYLLKIALHHRCQRISPQEQNNHIEKCNLMAASEDAFILETFLRGCFSKAATNIYSF